MRAPSPSNFVVSCPIVKKFSLLTAFDKFCPKSPEQFVRTMSVWSYDVIFFQTPVCLEVSRLFIFAMILAEIWLSGTNTRFRLQI